MWQPDRLDAAAPWWRAAATRGLLAASMLVAGCEMRDEQVRTTGGTGLWPRAADHPAPGRDGRVARDAGGIDFVAGYDAAARHAAGEARPLLLVFTAAWCRWSDELARGPLADPDVAARTRRFVCVLVDADREAATCRAFGVTGFPTVIVVDPDGRERFRATGSSAAGGLVSALDATPSTGAPRRRLADEGNPVTR